MNKKGFTLLDLLIGIAIVSLICATVVEKISNHKSPTSTTSEIQKGPLNGTMWKGYFVNYVYDSNKHKIGDPAIVVIHFATDTDLEVYNPKQSMGLVDTLTWEYSGSDEIIVYINQSAITYKFRFLRSKLILEGNNQTLVLEKSEGD
jgi:hypothetical protein